VFSVCSVFTGRCLVAASNNGYSPASVLTVNLQLQLLTQLTANQWPPTHGSSLLYRLGTDSIEHTPSCGCSVVACIFVATGACLLSRFLLMAAFSGYTIPPFRHRVTILYILTDLLKASLGDTAGHILAHAPSNSTVESFPSCLRMQAWCNAIQRMRRWRQTTVAVLSNPAIAQQ
jgi:hypothetical protein